MRWFTVLGLLALLGCSSQQEPKEPFAPNQQIVDESGFVLVIGLDLSGSFHHLLDHRAYDFTCNVIDKYPRDRISTQNEVILAQLSGAGSKKPLVWQGTPAELRSDFKSAEDFRTYLEKTRDEHGSRIYDGCADIIDFCLSQPSIASGKKRCVVLILSDMDDNAPNPEKSKPRLLQSLKRLAKADGRIGMYWVSQLSVAEWQKHLAEAGFPITTVVVESEIKSNPALPNFE
jgi:hypothetical protein